MQYSIIWLHEYIGKEYTPYDGLPEIETCRGS
jgi:hypothetical protein